MTLMDGFVICTDLPEIVVVSEDQPVVVVLSLWCYADESNGGGGGGISSIAIFHPQHTTWDTKIDREKITILVIGEIRMVTVRQWISYKCTRQPVFRTALPSWFTITHFPAD